MISLTTPPPPTARLPPSPTHHDTVPDPDSSQLAIPLPHTQPHDRRMQSTPTPTFPFQRFRQLRFAGRPRCPHCSTARVHRWGSFSGRRRYRCTACGRTFSDFTGTPLASLKHVDRWPAFCHCVLASLSVRQTAAYLGVDKTTAFRWRHRLLRSLNRSDVRPLGSTLIIHETSFPFSEKGKRGLDRPPRRRRYPYSRLDVPTVWAFIARDETGRTASGVVGRSRPRAHDLHAALEPRIRPDAEIVSSIGPYGAAGRLAIRTRRPYRRIDSRASDFMAVRRYILALRRWLRRFRGVATRYLSNYLAWHRLLTLVERAGPGAGFRWVLAARFP